MASFRLNKVAKDFNVGIQTLADYLAKKGHQIDATPNTKISEEQYELLATAFQSERKVKEEADKIELMTSGSNRVVEVEVKKEPEPENEEVIIKNYTHAKNQAEPEPEPEPEPMPESQEEPETPGSRRYLMLIVVLAYTAAALYVICRAYRKPEMPCAGNGRIYFLATAALLLFSLAFRLILRVISVSPNSNKRSRLFILLPEANAQISAPSCPAFSM